MARKESKQDQMSIRSHSSGIIDDINKEFKETGIRLNNMAKDVIGDSSMHYDNVSASMKNEENNSHRSGSLSSDSRSKRMMKSNKALLKKQLEMSKRNNHKDDNDDSEDFKNDGSDDYHTQIANMEPINNDQASNIFSKLEHEQGKKTYQAKKNWTEDEFKLLIWAINEYCKGKKIIP
jgi:hypothetical protein